MCRYAICRQGPANNCSFYSPRAGEHWCYNGFLVLFKALVGCCDTEQLPLVENMWLVKPEFTVVAGQFNEAHPRSIKRHCTQPGLTTAPDGGQELTNHTLGWRGISDPGQHLYSDQRGEFFQHWVTYCSLEVGEKTQWSDTAFYGCLIFWETIVAFDHLNLGCSWFGISKCQCVTTHPKLILQDKSTLRGRGDFTCWYAAVGKMENIKMLEKHTFSGQSNWYVLTYHRWVEAVPPGGLCPLLRSASPWKSSAPPSKTGSNTVQHHYWILTKNASRYLRSCLLYLVVGAVWPYAVYCRHGRMSEQVPVSMSRQHPLQTQMYSTLIFM